MELENSTDKWQKGMKEFQLGKSKEEAFELLPEKRIKKVILGNKTIAVMRHGENIFAFDSQCPHRGASLLQANINGLEEIICPLHQYRFDLKTGQVRAGYCPDLPVYLVRFSEEGIFITLP
jgi:nitrite reductase/ring-hydroxylating ferredoxin subunit